MLSFEHIRINPKNPTMAWRQLSSHCIQQRERLPLSKKGIRIVCISDTHNIHQKLSIPAGDILVHTGDATKGGRKEQLEAFWDWFSAQPFQHKIFVAGNHDITLDTPFYQKNWKRFHKKKEDLDDIKTLLEGYSDMIYLQDESCIIDGLKFYGSPWQPTFFHWAFNADRDDSISKKWAAIPADTDILLTHGPPLGYGDRCKTGLRAGCAHLLHEIMYRIQPKVHVFGHIHEAYGVTHNQQTQFVNAASCNLFYRYSQPPIVLDL